MAEDNVKKSLPMIAIGGSAGSLDAILKLLPAIRRDLYVAIVIILHRKASADTLLTDLLASRIQWPVKEAEEKEDILPHHVYIAPADYHLLIENDQSFSIDDSEKVNFSRPSIDVTFESAAAVHGPSLVAILLSGANADGAAGMQKVKAHGGLCIVQDPASAEVDFMPRQAIENVQVDAILPPLQIAAYLNGLAF
jgi:two-component system chemotaxis response regulator CheB